MTKLMKFSTAFVGIFMFIPGMVKFTDPFKTFFMKQIALSELPFPTLSYVFGQSGEIVTGIILLVVLLFWKKFPREIAVKLFIFGNIMVIPIMLVALHVHFHPDVPGEILPFENKAPILTVLLLILVVANFWQFNKYKKNIIA